MISKTSFILLPLFSLFFTACNSKASVVFKDRLVCYDMAKLEKSAEVQIRIHKDDVALFEARSDELKQSLDFYEKQIDEHNKNCKEIKNGKF